MTLACLTLSASRPPSTECADPRPGQEWSTRTEHWDDGPLASIRASRAPSIRRKQARFERGAIKA